MSKYSRIYKVGKRSFRFNYEHCVIEYIAKMDEQKLKENEEWLKEFGEPMWETDETGRYTILDSIGCFLEDWKESPKGMCEMWSDQIEEEMRCLMAYGI